MSYIDMVNEVIEYIESNIYEEISLDIIASKYFCSKFYFHRLFQSLVGKPLIQYIKERKIANAAILISDSDKKIIDIAYEIGFNSHSAFTRLFKNYYGITPEECRKYKIPVTIFDRACLKTSSINYTKPDFISYPKIVDSTEIKVVGLETTGTFHDNLKNKSIPKVWNKFHVRSHEIANVVKPYFMCGIGYDSNYLNSFNYLIGLKVTGFFDIPKDMICKEIPPSKYAVFTYKGIVEVEKFYQTLDYIWMNWLPNSSFQHNNIVDLIEVGTEKSTGRADNSYDIYIPIK